MHSDHSADYFNEATFEVFFKKYYSRLCIYCKFKFDLGAHHVEDIVSVSFNKLWEARRKLANEESSKSYLYKIIDSHCLDVLKHQEVEKRYINQLLPKGVEEAAPVNFDSIDLKELRSAIDTAIEELPEQMRRVFELSRYEGMKYNEIANHLGISVKTVETHMTRALAKMREKLSAWLTLMLLLVIF